MDAILENGENKATTWAKGIKKYVKNKLRFDQYKTCLFGEETVHIKQKLFASEKHHCIRSSL